MTPDREVLALRQRLLRIVTAWSIVLALVIEGVVMVLLISMRWTT